METVKLLRARLPHSAPLLALLSVYLVGCSHAPPAPPPVAAHVPTASHVGEADRLVASIANDQVEWLVGQFEADRSSGRFHLAGCQAVEGTPADTLSRGLTTTYRHLPKAPAAFDRDQLTPALMRALSDPKRFVAAHWMLTELYGHRLREERRAEGQVGAVFERRAHGSFVHHLDGLDVRLELVGRPEQNGTSGGEILEIWHCSATASEAQITSIAERWQKRLSVR